MNNPVTLVCTLGISAPIISETVYALLKKKENITKISIFHTQHPEVLRKSIKSSDGKITQEVGLNAFLTFTKNHFPAMRCELYPLPSDDIYCEQDNINLLNKLATHIRSERLCGNEVILSIAGGRKTMSAIGLVAAYLSDVKAVYHVITLGDEYQLTAKYGFEVPVRLLRLIELPILQIGSALQIVNKPTQEGLKQSEDVLPDWPETIKKLNENLPKQVELQQLFTDYHQNIATFSGFSHAIQFIITQLLSNGQFKIDSIHSRTKTFDSFLEKIERKRKSGKRYRQPLFDMTDISAVRVVLYYNSQINSEKSDVRPPLYELLETEFEIIEKVHKQPSTREQLGYESHHFILKLKPPRTELAEYKKFKDLKCELQVRTIFDQAWAQIEHQLSYKKAPEIKAKMKAEFYDKSEKLSMIRDEFDDIYQRYRD